MKSVTKIISRDLVYASKMLRSIQRERNQIESNLKTNWIFILSKLVHNLNRIRNENEIRNYCLTISKTEIVWIKTKFPFSLLSILILTEKKKGATNQRNIYYRIYTIHGFHSHCLFVWFSRDSLNLDTWPIHQ